VIADRLAIAVDSVYNHPAQYNTLSLVIATVFFTFQIFCDFSGYSDMQLCSPLHGFLILMTNFDKPYQSKAFMNFGNAGTFRYLPGLKYYLYISLGEPGENSPLVSEYFYCFFWSRFMAWSQLDLVIWGALHGFYLVFARFTKTFAINSIKPFY
jgi:D-alanyl-lipoteichoic acid acyltransferase DltB (MBOAT superfamily)